MHCPLTCCRIFKRPYRPQSKETYKNYRRPKAGAFFYDPFENRVLLVQSHAEKWGPPKGSMEECDDGSPEQCAIREIKEETNLLMTRDSLGSPAFIIDKTIYYYIQFDSTIPIITRGLAPDITGIAWMKVPCIEQMFRDGTLDINSHCKRCLAKFLHLGLK